MREEPSGGSGGAGNGELRRSGGPGEPPGPATRTYGQGVEVQPPLTEQLEPVALKQVGPLRGSFSHVLLLHPGAASAALTPRLDKDDTYGEAPWRDVPVTICSAATTATTRARRNSNRSERVIRTSS